MWVGWGKMVSHGKVADDRGTHTETETETETQRE